MHSITLDDREKTPNFGKPLFNPTSVLAVPETAVVGLRLYSRENGAEKAVGEVYAKTLPKGLELKSSIEPEKFAEAWKSKLGGVVRIAALVSIIPRDAGLSQKKPDSLRGRRRWRRHRRPAGLRDEAARERA